MIQIKTTENIKSEEIETMQGKEHFELIFSER